MSDDAERWKEKYLKGIEQQDKLESAGMRGSICCDAVWCAAVWRQRALTAPSMNA